MFKQLINSAIALAFVTILLGAYTRLTDAGLGCPDWPGCYGFITAPQHAEQIAQAAERFPQSKIEVHKAHNEMFHRYLAGFLGVNVVAIFLMSLWREEARALASCLLLLVMMQAALGMWTVTLNLMPVIVLGHLLGGFALFGFLVVLRIKLNYVHAFEPGLKQKNVRLLAWLALLVLLSQISLGAWTSSNYAALACHKLPLCEPGWQQRFSFAAAFHVPLGHSTYEYGVLSHNARLSIHVLHRIGAVITLVMVGAFAVFAWWKAKTKKLQRVALGIAGLLLLQVCLGIINVVASLPLLNAVAHNIVAANLLMLVMIFIYELYRLVPLKN